MEADSKKTLKFGLQLILVVAVFIAVFSLRDLVAENESIKMLVSTYGYFGILVISIIGGLNILVPIPAVAFLPIFLASGLSFWVTVIVIAIGTTLGDGVSYIIGAVGRHLVRSRKDSRVASRISGLCDNWCKRYRVTPFVILFLFAAFVPFPNEVLIIPLAFSGYRFSKMIPWVLVGNFIFSILSAFGVAGLNQLF